MVVIVHEAVRPCFCLKPLKRFTQNVKEQSTIRIVFNNGFAAVTTRSHVVNRACVFNAKRSDQVGILGLHGSERKMRDLTQSCTSCMTPSCTTSVP